MIYAYLRVSSSHQDEQNQRQGVDHIPWMTSVLGDIGTSGDGKLPNIVGDLNGLQYPAPEYLTGPFTYAGKVGQKAPNADPSGSAVNFNAGNVSNIYTDVDKVYPAYIVMQWCIKY